MGKTYFCLHAHFYQPPRENAWTDEIIPQPSAAPFHDWNERIYQECYKPNAEAVIVDDYDNVIRRINNYEYYSFNFGPTLLHWIRKKHPKTFEKIIEADRASTGKHNGHGNAIAQVYNHMIMPLANKCDKITQVKWGLADFRFHFGRNSEGIWLPETACDPETLEVLAGEGIKFTILDQSQAEKTRKINKGKWKNVSDGSIDPKEPYRHFIGIDRKKYIDIFFYDGALSRNIAFDGHVYDARLLMNRINESGPEPPLSLKNVRRKKDALISVAVDGETFGHHKKYSERTIAYLMTELLEKNGYKITNFGEYLSFSSPCNEVMIKPGEGTSWSCAHGVGRWKEDCGCNSGSNPGWNQQWRKPLRETLNWLRDELAGLFESRGGEYLKDVWNARNDYIWLIIDRSDKSRNDFFYFHSKKFLDEKETGTCIKLLEMQKYAMLMFTSCGWFFDDISGIETIQILEYAARAIELAYDVSGKNYENEFLEKLSGSRSNLGKHLDGRNIYEQEVKAIKKEIDSEFKIVQNLLPEQL